MEEIFKMIETLLRNDFAVSSKNVAKIFENTITSSFDQREENIVEHLSTLHHSESGRDFSLTVNSVYIHGNKSQVDFDFYNSNTQRELGDIIFISSLYISGVKVFEKVSINQVKKGQSKFTLNQSGIEQLYLLSRLPKFKGHCGLIPKKYYTLIDNSNTLCSYGLLYSPGDFAFISAKSLSEKLGQRKTFHLKDIQIDDCVNNDELRYFFGSYHYNRKIVLPILDTKLYCSNIYDFILHYLRLNIGEVIFDSKYSHVINLELKRLVEDIFSSLISSTDNAIRNFAREYLVDTNQTSEFEAGGLRIVWAKTDLTNYKIVND